MVYPLKAWMVFDATVYLLFVLFLLVYTLEILKRTPALSPLSHYHNPLAIASDTCIVLTGAINPLCSPFHPIPHPPQKPCPLRGRIPVGIYVSAETETFVYNFTEGRTLHEN